MALWIILIVLVLIVGFVISVYNGLVRSKMNVENAWSQIDVQLQRRFDLIPNFVETVKGRNFFNIKNNHGCFRKLS